MVAAPCAHVCMREPVHSAASAVLAEHGQAGYKKKWVEHEFPSRQLELLAEYISRWQHDR